MEILLAGADGHHVEVKQVQIKRVLNTFFYPVIAPSPIIVLFKVL